MRQMFVPYNPQARRRAVVEHVNAIIDEYRAKGFTLTVRQIFYQFVARGWIENWLRSYWVIRAVIAEGRDGGLIDWDAIEDRGREVVSPSTWSDPAQIIEAAANSYREDLWAGQTYRPEVWIEKASLIGLIENVCKAHRVPFVSTGGDNSISVQYAAAQRFTESTNQGQTPLVLHLADHDPRGLNMTDVTMRRLALYAREDIEVHRLALNIEQVREFNPPPSFAKENSAADQSLAIDYEARFGTKECWELDALPPDVLAALIGDELDGLKDQQAWAKALAHENRNRKRLARAAADWDKR